jgi:hypothetical protein
MERTLRLGRNPTRWTTQNLRKAHRIQMTMNALPPPPAVSADFMAAVFRHTKGNWGMFLNDQLGDCVPADTGHELMLRTANTGVFLRPTNNDILKLYEAVGKYVPGDPATDQGCEEGAMCQYMVDTGLLGHKSIDYAAIATVVIDTAAITRIKWGIQLFGCVRLGVNLPQSAEDQFNAGQEWTVSGDATILGGHGIPAVKYDTEGVWLVTWGKRIKASWQWLMTYGEEAWGEIYPDFIRSNGLSPDGFSLAQLIADLKEIAR